MSVRCIALVSGLFLWAGYANLANDSVKIPADQAGEQIGTSRQTANNRPAFGKNGASFTGKKAVNADHPLRKALQHANTVIEAMRDVEDYEATFSKRVNIRGKLVAETMYMKVREKPFSVYLKFANPHQGREVLFIEGKNGDKILAHEAGLKGLAGTLELAPTSKLAMENNVYPITEIGMSKLIHQVTDHWETLLEVIDARVRFFPAAKLGESACFAIEVTTPQQIDGVRYHMWRIYFDKRDNIPVRVELYGFPRRPGEQPPLLEEYTYSQVRLNVGLTDHDFSTENSAYRF